MAEVDFTNARIEPVSIQGSNNPSQADYLNLTNSVLKDANGNSIVTNHSRQTLKDVSKQFVFLYSGKFTASGTEFYLSYALSAAWWKVSNISFSSGDTYTFKIRADLICQ